MVYVGGKPYLRGYTIDAWGNTVLVLTPVQMGPTQSSTQPSSPTPPTQTGPRSPSYVYRSASRNFWIWNGTSSLSAGYLFPLNRFNIGWLSNGGVWNFNNGVNVNERPQGLTDKEWNHFLNQAGIYGIQGLMVAQNVAAIFFTPETVGGSDALDAALDAEEVTTLTKLEQGGETEVAEVDVDSEINDAINDISENKQNHIMQAKHDWDKVTDDSSWGNVKNIIQNVMKNGEQIPDEDTPNLYFKELKIGDETVNVSYFTGNGKVQITNAWVNY